MRRPRLQIAILITVTLASLSDGGWTAENTDPNDDGSQYAFGENVGWIDAEPGGEGGPGMEVYDFYLTGWMWGENMGWISLSCLTTDSCFEEGYAVRNDGQGMLSGFAWSENRGWINFGPPGSGVFIDPITGSFSGKAWSENVGWISFASTGTNPFEVRTSWNCSPPPSPPPMVPLLNMEMLGMDPDFSDMYLSWGGVSGATGYDVVSGRLDDLVATGGDFSVSMEGCVEDNLPLTSTNAAPTGFTNRFFLLRPVNCGGNGTYDSGGAGQLGTRDGEVVASGSDCS